MKTTLVIFIILLCAGNSLLAQNARFTTSGTITYEKSINMFAIINNLMDADDSFGKQIFEEYKKNQPQFKKMQSTLTFADNKTLYKPIVPETMQTGAWSTIPSANQFNTIYADFSAASMTTLKVVFDDSFLIKDSLTKIKWKITDETREIAGYNCRRANGLVQDSIYLVAFYTDKIPVSGGPESFCGLPGMILELAIPHENLKWLATKVTDEPVTDNTIQPPKKGKAVNNKQLYDTLKSVMKNWGKEGKYYLRMFLL